MHDLDRTQAEMEAAEPETDIFELEFEGETGGLESRLGGVFDEVEEMELASQLLEIQDEYEMDEFLGKLIKRASRAVGKFVSSPTGKALGGILKGAAKKLLPVAGTALGALGGPLGAAVGGNLAGMAGKALGLELEGLSEEDQEFEVARQFVRFAGEAAKNAATAPPSAPPAAAAKGATVAAAKKHAPGLLRPSSSVGPPVRRAGGRSGRWIRRGTKIVLLGV
jgi:hypothetical protein